MIKNIKHLALSVFTAVFMLGSTYAAPTNSPAIVTTALTVSNGIVQNVAATTFPGGIVSTYTGSAVGLTNIPNAQPPFSIVVIPDSQYLTATFSNLWNDQIAWISNNAASMNIKAVIHLGDLVDFPNSLQLSNAMYGITNLRASNVPFIIAPGNHDCNTGSTDPQDLQALSAAGLTPGWFSNYSNFGNGWTMGFQNSTSLLGSYLLFTNGTQPYLIITLAWLPNNTTMLWASNICQIYSNIPCIYAQHAFVDSDPAGMRLSWDSLWSVERTGLGSTWLTPNQLWYNWISTTRNIFWVASGHTINYTVNGVSSGYNCNYLIDHANDGHDIMQSLCDFQLYETTEGEGSNFLQMIQFTPSQNIAKTYTVAPSVSKPLQVSHNSTYTWTPFTSATVTNTPWQTAQADSSHLLLYLNFENTNGFKDLSPFSANIINSNLTTVPTALGRSLYCTNASGFFTNFLSVGASYANVAAGLSEKAELNQFAGLTNMTVSFWLNMTNYPLGGGTEIFCGQFNSGTAGSWYMGVNAGLIRFSTINSALSRIDNQPAATPSLIDGVWHHIVGTYDGANTRVYIDTVLYNTAAQSGVLSTASALPLTIGANTLPTASPLNGLMDEFKILSIAWTPEQITQEYNRVRNNMVGGNANVIKLGTNDAGSLTNLNAANLIGTIPQAALGNALTNNNAAQVRLTNAVVTNFNTASLTVGQSNIDFNVLYDEIRTYEHDEVWYLGDSAGTGGLNFEPDPVGLSGYVDFHDVSVAFESGATLNFTDTSSTLEYLSQTILDGNGLHGNAAFTTNLQSTNIVTALRWVTNNTWVTTNDTVIECWGTNQWVTNNERWIGRPVTIIEQNSNGSCIITNPGSLTFTIRSLGSQTFVSLGARNTPTNEWTGIWNGFNY